MATYWENSCSFGLRYVSWYKYLIVGLVFSHLDFWSGNRFLIAPFPYLCLLVPFYSLLDMFQVSNEVHGLIDLNNFSFFYEYIFATLTCRHGQGNRTILITEPENTFCFTS